jgi:sortase A
MKAPPTQPSKTPAATSAGSTSSRRRLLGTILGGAGEAILTLGVVLALFVVWELWWTDIGASRHQRELVAGLSWEEPAAVMPIEGSGVVSPGTDAPVYRVVAEENKERVESPPSIPAPDVADTFATLYVPRWGLDYIQPISEGVSRRTILDRLGIGHYPETALPGGWGNFAIAGHRTTFGKPFSRIEELEIGDRLIVRTEFTWFVYRVTETKIVRPWYSAAIAPVPGDASLEANGRYITLTTCHPPLSARYRYVVYGVLDYWAPASTGYPPELVPKGARTVEGLRAAIEGMAH